MPNPFFFGGHVTDPDQFVGRSAGYSGGYRFRADLVRRWVLQNANA